MDWVFCLSGDEVLHATLSTLLYVTGIWSECVPLAIRRIENGHKLYSEMPQPKTKQKSQKKAALFLAIAVLLLDNNLTVSTG